MPPRWEIPGRFKCEGRVLSGYPSGCIDFQPMAIEKKWDMKLASFTEAYTTHLSTDGWTKLWELAALVGGSGACFGFSLSCGESAVITMGATAIPCLAASAVACTISATGFGVVGNHCKELVTVR